MIYLAIKEYLLNVFFKFQDNKQIDLFDKTRLF